MLIENERFEKRLQEPAAWENRVYRFCDFVDMDTEGGMVDSVFMNCSLDHCGWYWGLFNMALFVDVNFINCTFRGTSFSGSKFVDCDFVDCVFTSDNLGGSCTFSDVVWHGCTHTGCTGIDAQFRSKATREMGHAAKRATGAS